MSTDPSPSARKPALILKHGATPIPPSLQAKMAAMALRNTQQQQPEPAQLLLHRAPHSFPAPSPPQPRGLGARRLRPNFNIRDIDAHALDGAALASAGLAPGRPHDSPAAAAARRPMDTPFANFSKIVCVPPPAVAMCPAHCPPATHPAPSTSPARPS